MQRAASEDGTGPMTRGSPSGTCRRTWNAATGRGRTRVPLSAPPSKVKPMGRVENQGRRVATARQITRSPGPTDCDEKVQDPRRKERGTRGTTGLKRGGKRRWVRMGRQEKRNRQLQQRMTICIHQISGRLLPITYHQRTVHCRL
jgi:hypothetical protein